MSILIPVVLLAGVALYFMTPDERRRLGEALLDMARRAIQSALQASTRHEPFGDFLRARTRWPLVTWLLVVLHVTTFAAMAMDTGSVGDPDVLIRWGAHFPPRTTNGEWWRLLTSTFVHSGLLHLLATIAGLLSLGLILERAVGHTAFAAVYIASAIISGVVSLWTASPVAVNVGASAAIGGLYGLFFTSVIWAVTSRFPVRMPWSTAKRIAGGAAVFGLYNAVTSDLAGTSEVAGLLTGLGAGAVLSRGIGRAKPPLQRPAFVMVATAVIVLFCALPLRGLIDIRPEIARLIALEDRTVRTYDAAVAEFRKGWISSDALAAVIDRKIIPEIQAAHTRIRTLRGIPGEHRPVIWTAASYLQLREETWRQRRNGLVKAKMAMLREADRSERAALEALQKIRGMAQS